jgi:exopolysaccharide biosynthesis WecB/TagA/CpsF family protein
VAAVSVNWPARHDVFGVQVSATTYDQAEAVIIEAARQRRGAVVTHMPVHGLITAATDAKYRECVNRFDIIAPDGQPVRWALNKFHDAGLDDRCYGPELMIRLCRRAAEQHIGVYLYGSTPEVIEKLSRRLLELCPGLKIAGSESPPFRPLSDAERQEVVGRINDSGAGLVFIGLGCPRQDYFAGQTKNEIHAVQLCVGAAFDFHAGNKKMAPAWMQRMSLEWLFRLTHEPGRLWKRYLVTNSIFLMLCAKRLIAGDRKRQVVTP